MADQSSVRAAAPAANVGAPASRRWLTEDWMAVLLGFLVIAAVLMMFQWKVADLRNVVPTFRWTTDSQIASMTPGWIDALDAIARDAAGQAAAERRGARARP